MTSPFTAVLRAGAAVPVCLALGLTDASAVPLVFDSFSPGLNGINSLGRVVRSDEIRFTNVATDNGVTVDARVRAIAVKPETDFPLNNGTDDYGYLPNYTPNLAEPNDDLGFRFRGNNINATENGVIFEISFFNGTGPLANTFVTPIAVSELEFAIYDVDGEPGQSEFFRARKSEGLFSYQLGTTPQALVATEQGDVVRFDGPGTNFSETDASGAAILTYRDVSSFTLDFGSVMTSGPSQNPVFTAFDGDLSLFDRDAFDDPILIDEPPRAVPLPAGLPLMLVGLGALAYLGRRRG